MSFIQIHKPTTTITATTKNKDNIPKNNDFLYFNFIIQNTLPREIKGGSISTIVDSYFRIAIGITPSARF